MEYLVGFGNWTIRSKIGADPTEWPVENLTGGNAADDVDWLGLRFQHCD